MKKIMVALCLLLAGTIGSWAQKSAVFTGQDGAIHGYDAVAYFKESKPVKGDKKFVYNWNNAAWYFSTQQNLDSFKTNPQHYAPQYGGYCAYGMADGHKAPTDPEAWSVIDDKLYLNYSKNVQQLWKKKPAEYIQTANKNWPTLKDKE